MRPSPLGPEKPPPAGFTFVHSGEAEWKEAAPGMWLKVLHADPSRDRMTALARMDPGCAYAPHRHAGAEELFVLEGTCNCGGRVLQVGDYHRAEAGSIHYETSTQDGCLMLVIFSPDNEMLEPSQA